ncbi:LysR family transcriptional regulator [Paracoccus aminophilus]|uniref:Transcriptional regulator, LysR family n=1 Tax=Paracoccus aminophilus JCM 7686 TaxID=1367847 RepID=S5XTT1_PARAH|nr:LysR substrate-binding domain-containing protein [Paracoccus aminophilus]AGT10924.1 transcriptional regulator, LysR family [Paracoccus aminophilus JCM 7686]
MNIRQIEAFHETMETGSVTRAAERLGVSQPAISKLLKALMEDCGFQLFHRKGGQLVPTREAQLFATEVAALFNGTRRLKKVAQAIRQNELGEVSVAAPPAVVTRFLPTALAEGLQDLPDLLVQIVSRPSPQIIDMVGAGLLDLGVVTMATDRPDLEAEHLATLPLICLLPADHPLTAKAELCIEDLREQPIVTLPSSDCTFSRTDRSFQMRSVPMGRRIEVPYSETAAHMVAQGVGVAIVAPFVGLEYGPDRIARRPLLPADHIDLWLLRPRNRALSLAAARVRQVILAAFAPD